MQDRRREVRVVRSSAAAGRGPGLATAFVEVGGLVSLFLRAARQQCSVGSTALVGARRGRPS